MTTCYVRDFGFGSSELCSSVFSSARMWHCVVGWVGPTCLWDWNVFMVEQSNRILEDEGTAFIWNMTDPTPSNTGHITFVWNSMDPSPINTGHITFVWNLTDLSPTNKGHNPCDLNPRPQILPVTCLLVTAITFKLVDISSQMLTNKLATARC
jgi:hypothetical protein